eukprot:8164020-Alexandrium_andersonii.AAC.1
MLNGRCFCGGAGGGQAAGASWSTSLGRKIILQYSKARGHRAVSSTTSRRTVSKAVAKGGCASTCSALM